MSTIGQLGGWSAHAVQRPNRNRLAKSSRVDATPAAGLGVGAAIDGSTHARIRSSFRRLPLCLLQSSESGVLQGRAGLEPHRGAGLHGNLLTSAGVQCSTLWCLAHAESAE